MKHPILGLHHVTATVDQAQPDLDFYVDLLGLRLIKRTVNFDNHNVYHFYYGNERGAPGTIWTTFPYGGWGVPEGRHGEGQITTTSFSVPQGSLGWWRERLRRRGVTPETSTESGGERITFKDSSGLVLELRENPDPRPAWTGHGIEPGFAIRGLDSVTLTIGRPGPTIALLTELLGFTIIEEREGLVALAVNGTEAGKRVELLHGTNALPARNGLGTVHHVAFAIADGEQQRRLRTELLEMGYHVTDVLDRQYFQSIYFREPGGVLFEVATAGPGFTVDEELGELGRELKLPLWEEPNRAEIERQLAPVNLPSMTPS
jgi:glyoxalase family protein